MPISTLFLAFAAQAAASPQPATAAAALRAGRTFVSPMGEPFREGPRGDALAGWFNQADSNHDGILTVVEMQADADRFFNSLDTDHDGEIGPEEVTRYETEVAPEVEGEPTAMYDAKNSSDDEGGQPADPDPDAGGTDISGGGAMQGPEGAGRFGLLNLPEPVTAADTDINRSITRDEFRHAASQRFALLDTSHSGRLRLAQLEAMRPGGSSLSFHHRHGGGRHGGALHGQGQQQP